MVIDLNLFRKGILHMKFSIDKQNKRKSFRNNKSACFFKQGDIVFCDLGKGEPSEQRGIRPCLIIQNDIGNKYSSTTLVAPISAQIKYNKNGNLQPTHYIVENYKEVGLKTRSMILFEQIRTISKKRIQDDFPVGHIKFDDIKDYILVAFGIQDNKETANIN